jgi:hypothetical protein
VASLPRFLPVLLCLGAAVNCETSGGSIILPPGGGGAPTGSQRTELMLAIEDEVEAAITALTLTGQGMPPTFTPPAGCPTATASGDTDTDGIPDDQTLTFANPPCTLTPFRGAGASFDITGELQIRDTTTDTTSISLTYTDLAWTGTDPATTRTFTATRTGTRTRTGDDSTATLTSDLNIIRARPARANATIDLVTTSRFVADSDTVRIGQALPGGGLVITGTMQWRRSTENWSLTLDTPTPLHVEPTCITTPQMVDSGVVTLTGTVSGSAGVLTLIWEACGTDPTTSWTSTP